MPASSSESTVKKQMGSRLFLFIAERACVVMTNASILKSKEGRKAVLNEFPHKEIHFVGSSHPPNYLPYLCLNMMKAILKGKF